jgi:hypothetical protein
MGANELLTMTKRSPQSWPSRAFQFIEVAKTQLNSKQNVVCPQKEQKT